MQSWIVLFGGAFVAIEHAVGALDEFRYLVAVLEGPPADGEGNGQFPALDNHFEIFQASEDRGKLIRLAIDEQHHEFVAAPASGEVGTASGMVEALAKFLEDSVTGLVAVGVVDLLEIVDVDQNDNQGQALAFGAGNLCFEALFGIAAVVKAGQGIEHREAAKHFCLDLLLGQLALEAAKAQMLEDDLAGKHEHKRNEDLNGGTFIQAEKCLLARKIGGESEDGDRKGQDDGDSVGPNPEVAALEALKVGANFGRAKIGLLVVDGRGNAVGHLPKPPTQGLALKLDG
jgi:hypothetical protein